MEFLKIQISGKIQNSNFLTWKDNLLTLIHSTKLDLTTDGDFVTASDDVKTLKVAETTLKEAKINAIAQTDEIQSLFTALDEVTEQARQARLALERQIRAKKQEVKSELIYDAIKDVRDYLASKNKIFNNLDHSRHLQDHLYETAIKGKSTINTVQNSLNKLVRKIKENIDTEYKQVIRNLALIETIPSNERLLFQDVNHLVRLPENELQLTIENRITQLSEQKSTHHAANIEKELNVINDESLSEIKNKLKNHYVISVEILAPRQDAIHAARKVKNSLIDLDSVIDIKLRLHK